MLATHPESSGCEEVKQLVCTLPPQNSHTLNSPDEGSQQSPCTHPPALVEFHAVSCGISPARMRRGTQQRVGVNAHEGAWAAVVMQAL